MAGSPETSASRNFKANFQDNYKMAEGFLWRKNILFTFVDIFIFNLSQHNNRWLLF